MNNMSEKKRRNDYASEGSGSAKGRSSEPKPDHEREKRQPDEPVREIPIGMPMDPEEFRRRKEEAEKPENNGDARDCKSGQDDKSTN
jgi:hypothetical protein